MENLFTVKEAATALSIAPATLRSWVFHRKIDYLKINGCIRFRGSDLRRLINSCTRRGTGHRRFRDDDVTASREKLLSGEMAEQPAG